MLEFIIEFAARIFLAICLYLIGLPIIWLVSTPLILLSSILSIRKGGGYWVSVKSKFSKVKDFWKAMIDVIDGLIETISRK